MWRIKRNGKKKVALKVVGTEAAAKKSLERDQKDFRYPDSGFVSPVEYTSLYSMFLDAPKIYPKSVIRNAIREEDFHQYLIVNPLRPNETEEVHSYAQLSALLTPEAENFPSPQKASEAVRNNTIPQILLCACFR